MRCRVVIPWCPRSRAKVVGGGGRLFFGTCGRRSRRLCGRWFGCKGAEGHRNGVLNCGCGEVWRWGVGGTSILKTVAREGCVGTVGGKYL
jgi:hypothetical protein